MLTNARRSLPFTRRDYCTYVVPMASSANTEDVKLDEAKEAMADIVKEAAPRQVHEHDTRARKPRLGNMGVRQSWKECVGESWALPYRGYTGGI